MGRWSTVILTASLLALAAFSGSADAQQKTVAACRGEWRANEADFKAKRITEKAYIAQCRAGTAAARPTPSAPIKPARTAPAAGAAPVKTAAVCRAEWRANKAGYVAAKITESAYVKQCRAGQAVALPTTAPSVPPPSSTATPAKPVAPTAKPSPRVAVPSPTGAGEFQTVAQANAHCPSDTVVWVNLVSKIYHFAGYKNYGNTKRGAYMCEKEATGQGFRASKTEKHPGV
jgi:hypothetical protein